MAKRGAHTVPSLMKDRYDAITGITDGFCRAHLNDEYRDLARRMTAALSRKRPSPIAKGEIDSWAGAVLYSLGRVNFLFDRSQEPHMSVADLFDRLGVSRRTAENKARRIWSDLKLSQLDPAWCLPSMLDDNPLAWLVVVDGCVIDARSLPREMQEQACRLGLIPYVPESRA